MTTPLSENWSHCAQCSSSAVTFRSDGPTEFACDDCGHEWDGQVDWHDREPEINGDR